MSRDFQGAVRHTHDMPNSGLASVVAISAADARQCHVHHAVLAGWRAFSP